MMLESALLDVAPDEALELNKKKRMLRWDVKKRKFVKVCYYICLYI
jgi:ATP-dependent RNA helicase DDX54/DBP10